jgi:bifunctional non-homologous end joining protein LigD
MGRFEGEIPAGEYGAGTASVLDHGAYELHEWADWRVSFALQRERLQGLYEMVSFKKAGEKEWLILKRND